MGSGLNIAEAPAWLLAAISRIQSSHTQHKRQTGDGKILEGQRNNALVRIAGALQRVGMSRESIEATLLAENNRRCEPPVAESEIRSIVASVVRYPPVDTEARAQATDVPAGNVGAPQGNVEAERDRPSFEQKWEAFRAEAQGGKVRNIADVVCDFQDRLYMPDPGLVHVTLGAYAANLLAGSPLWLLLVGPPSSGKTDILNSLRLLPCLHSAATLTEGSLLSGTSKRDRTKDATGGLLRQIGDFGIIVAKDFTSVLSMHPEARCAVLAALREIYDGEWTRLVGTDGGRELHWEGKVAFIGGVTPVLDQHQGVMAAMGERFIYYRLPSTDPEQQALRAIENSGRSREIAQELADSVAQLFRGVILQRQERNSIADASRFVSLAALTAHSRSAVIRDARTREVELVPESEMPARLAQTLISLDDGLAVIGTNPAERWRLVCKVALDSLPALRRRALFAAIESDVGLSAAEFAIRVQHPTTTVRRALEDLAAHGVLRRRRDRSADTWEATAKTRSRWEAAGLVLPAELEDVSTEALSIVVEAA